MPTPPRKVHRKLGMAKNFAKSILSRGLSNKKANKITKQLRVISCFGDGEELIPCEYLRTSEKDDNKSFCGGCGCGDRKGTWLVANGDEYSKLDYPKLACPLQMPGFTNYEESEPDEADDPITRRFYIEQMDPERIKAVEVTLNEHPVQNTKKKKKSSSKKS
tara:strand:- start:159 stop:644 length:486 start_codon:yes stop_codon:yes gene_type:complete